WADPTDRLSEESSGERRLRPRLCRFANRRPVRHPPERSKAGKPHPRNRKTARASPRDHTAFKLKLVSSSSCAQIQLGLVVSFGGVSSSSCCGLGLCPTDISPQGPPCPPPTCPPP